MTVSQVLQALPSALYTLRAASIAAVIAFSFMTQDVLDAVESVCGAVCVISSSMLLPTVFHAAMRHKRGLMRAHHWAAVVLLMLFGTGLTAVVLFQTAAKLAAWLGGGAESTAAEPMWREATPSSSGTAAELGGGFAGMLDL